LQGHQQQGGAQAVRHHRQRRQSDDPGDLRRADTPGVLRIGGDQTQADRQRRRQPGDPTTPTAGGVDPHRRDPPAGNATRRRVGLERPVHSAALLPGGRRAAALLGGRVL
jgi:hypothetical protein